jgi:SAM-dependent methyltransferase
MAGDQTGAPELMPQRTGFGIAARDVFMYLAGLVFLTLAKAKNILSGYSSPKPFRLAEIDRCIAYDLQVVDEWLKHLRAYAGDQLAVRDKAVLELGPGSDLGVGLYLLAKGAAVYHACDVNDLTQYAPAGFYAALVDRIIALQTPASREFLESQIEDAQRGTASKLRVVVRSDFDLVSSFGADSIDIVFSQAAFEHFDDVVRTVQQLSIVCRPGATIVAEIDLKTHSRWIRDKDPNNIYRYSNSLYRAFWFRGIPNRVRPYQYQQIFERHGWVDVSVVPIERVTDRQIAGAVDMQFRDSRNQLDFLSIVLCARKPPAGQ